MVDGASSPVGPWTGIDGALVMFIPPGTRQEADLGQLDKVDPLAASLPVDADGGITRPIAEQCADRGAGYLISGRALLTTTMETSTPPIAERRPA